MSIVHALTDSPEALEALSRVELLYTDLDGTLFAPGGTILADAEGTPSARLAEAIVDLNRAGLTVVPISGREDGQLLELVRFLGWRDYIAEAGALIVQGRRADGDVVLNHGTWPAEWFAEESPTPFERIAESGALEALFSAFPGRIENYDTGVRPRLATHLLRGCVDLAEANEVLEPLSPPVELVDNGRVSNAGTLTCDDALPHAFHVVAKGVSKVGAIRIDLEKRGLDASRAAAIGDSVADVGMADAVGVMALVGNGLKSPRVRAELERRPRSNVYGLREHRTDGWAEFARAWLKARVETG